MSVISKKPKYLRTAKSTSKRLKIDREGGEKKAGIIRGASLVTEGEALGHYAWLDRIFMESVAEAASESASGIKVRFTHPGLSADGLGTFMGRAKNAKFSGTQVFADVHFSKSSHNTPDGDLAEYVMSLAEEDPKSFAISIVFQPDIGAEDKFIAEHEDEDGNFQSPDENNVSNLPHARLADLRAADFVDEPAANPEGLFHKGHEIADEADRLCAYALGLSDEKPELVHLGADVDRIAVFAERFLDNHDLALKEKTMSDLTKEDVQGMIDKSFSEGLKASEDRIAKLLEDHQKAEEQTDQQLSVKEAIQAEQQRCNELFALAKNAGLEDWDKVASGWIDKNLSVVDAKASLADAAIASNKLTSDTGDGNPDPDLAYKKEYQQNLAAFASMGLSEEEYITSRKIDEGQELLAPKKESAAA